MYRAIIFDFNGVVVDDEPIHYLMFQKICEEEGVTLNKQDYYQYFLGYDDHDCLMAIYKFYQKDLTETDCLALIHKKEKYYKDYIDQQLIFVPGVVDFIEKISNKYYVAVVSGALRSEIEYLLAKANLLKKINVIVAAGETSKGKPEPDPYLKALHLLNRDFVQASDVLLANECLVFEDSPWGIVAASKAEMSCVGVMTSYPAADLKPTLACIKDFKDEKLIDMVG